MKKYNIGIVGGGGYTAGELLRILAFHPAVKIQFVYSASQAGKLVQDVHTDLKCIDDIVFTQKLEEVDVLFLCQGHGKAIEFMKNHSISEETIVIDLGNDFRINNREWTYGLPERNKSAIGSSKRIANPGCFATGIQLSLLPLASGQLLNNDIHISAVTGSTGAGQSLSRTSHFTWRNNNISVYKAFGHQHEAEVIQCVKAQQRGFDHEIFFLPHRGNFARGIYGSVYTSTELDEKELIDCYRSYYEDHPFVKIYIDSIDLKSVVNTNFCYLEAHKNKGKALIHFVLDNLCKGASGQAVQNMNLALNLPENQGLQLKPIAY